MNDSQPSPELVEAALAPGHPTPVGRYRLDLVSGRWTWSDEVFAMHGFAPGDIVPTTDLILAHKHPDDRARVDHVLRSAATTGRPFSSVHRIIDAHGGTRTLAVTGQSRVDASTGAITELYGYFIDVSDAHHEQAQREATASIRAAAEHRAAIEQAKGVIMVTFGISSDEAFSHLRTASNQLNVPVRDLATWLIHWFSNPAMTEFPTSDQVTDFLTAPIPADQPSGDRSDPAPDVVS